MRLLCGGMQCLQIKLIALTFWLADSCTLGLDYGMLMC